MDASTFISFRLTQQHARELDHEVGLRRRIAEHRAARREEPEARSQRSGERRTARDVALAGPAA